MHPDNPDTLYITNPRSGRIEAVPRNMPSNAPPAPVPPPNFFQRRTGFSMVDYSANPELKSQSVTLRAHATGLEQAEKKFAAIQDKALADGLLNPDGSWSKDASRFREIELAQMQHETARRAVAYEHTVPPALKANAAALERELITQDIGDSVSRMETQLADRPTRERIVTIEAGGQRDRIILGGPQWPSDLLG